MHDDRVPVKNVGPDLLAEMKYESRDVAQQKLWGWILIFFIGFVASMFITAGVYALFIPNWYKLGQVPAPSPYRKLPPVPQLQIDPRKDMQFFRQAEMKQVSGVEGATPNSKPRMTIEAAIDKLAGEEGIAGIKGTDVPARGTAYPGSRDYTGGAPAGIEPGKADLSGGEMKESMPGEGAKEAAPGPTEPTPAPEGAAAPAGGAAPDAATGASSESAKPAGTTAAPPGPAGANRTGATEH